MKVKSSLFASGDYRPVRAQKEQLLEPTQAAQEFSPVATKWTHKVSSFPVYEK